LFQEASQLLTIPHLVLCTRIQGPGTVRIRLYRGGHGRRCLIRIDDDYLMKMRDRLIFRLM
jgi:hypothetical protein